MEQKRNFVGVKIRRLRNTKDISQQKLSVLCSQAGYEITRSILAKIEAEIRAISDIELYVIAVALEVKVEDLYPDDFTKMLHKGKIEPYHVRRV